MFGSNIVFQTQTCLRIKYKFNFRSQYGAASFQRQTKEGDFLVQSQKAKSYKIKHTSTGRSPHKSPATKRMLLSQRSSTPFNSPSVKVPCMIWHGIDTILENVHSPLSTQVIEILILWILSNSYLVPLTHFWSR